MTSVNAPRRQRRIQEHVARSDRQRPKETLTLAMQAGARPYGGGAPAREKEPTAKTAEELQRLMERYPEVQLATLVDKPPEGVEWLQEIKFDGYRLLGFVSGGTPRLRTRNGKDWTASFPIPRCGAGKTEGQRCRAGHGSGRPR